MIAPVSLPLDGRHAPARRGPAAPCGVPPALGPPDIHRFVVLTAAAILTTGRRTVTNVLRTVGDLAPGHDASYRRVRSAAGWSGLELGCALTGFLLALLVPHGPVDLVRGDTFDGHPKWAVYGKGWHRDAVRSSHSYTAWRYGDKWVVLAVLVKLPFATRRWALPALVDIYRTPEVSMAEDARHRTPAQLMCRSLRLVLVPIQSWMFYVRRELRARYPRGRLVLL